MKLKPIRASNLHESLGAKRLESSDSPPACAACDVKRTLH